jgi:hypothetical protein
MKNNHMCLALSFTLLILVACGGDVKIEQSAKKTAILTIKLTGKLPINTAIAGTDFTLTLPTGVTPAVTNSTVDSGVVSSSGTFVGGTQMPAIYTAATVSVPGRLRVALVNPAPAGVKQVGEVATIILQRASNTAPTVASFGVSSVSVIDAARYGTINGMGANVANVVLQ